MYEQTLNLQAQKLGALEKFDPNMSMEIKLEDYIKLLTISHIMCKMCVDDLVPQRYLDEIYLTVENK